MIVFDRLIDQAVSNQQEYSSLRTVVEKEVLHHDILRIMNENGLLKQLVFIGGTCLRDCYGSNRLSEDLDFSAGRDFDGELFNELSKVFKDSFLTKYDLPVEIKYPKITDSSVKTWKLLIQTRPGQHLPAQRIHIDINQLPSYNISPRMLQNNYGVDLGTSGLIIQAESRAEILTDKYLALGLRLNRIKNRDLWDIVWLNQNGIKPDAAILLKKLKDFNVEPGFYIDSMNLRVQSLADAGVFTDFKKEMIRFLPTKIVTETVNSTEFWSYLGTSISENWAILRTEINGSGSGKFLM